MAATGKDKPLTDKQEHFCKEVVLNGGNQSAAYRVAYNAEKMKPETVNVKASELMANGNISVRVKELRKRVAQQADEKFDNTIDGLLEEYTRWLDSDITEFMYLDEEGVKALPRELRKLITEFKRTDKQVKQDDGKYKTESTFALKFVSKEKAAEMINKHRGFYEKDNEQSKPTFNQNSEIVFTDASGDD